MTKQRKSNKAHTDISTGKIYGCKKGSWKWYHEKGHLVFNEQEDTSWLLMLKSYLFDLWMFSVMIALIYKIGIIFVCSSWLIYSFITLYEENWCNKYANSKVPKFKEIKP